ncbi:response regulator transcription factor [Cupriavidus sp. D39]|uniref:response regulator transcription factor n=1 Tax=Cupriavidus sp. D39 TaxID=2997877 RepID=UPI002270396F|nr:response regulator transcription factor [Cupriavidus sp. D39]MCY0858772.1 response regulator transcription factor [Cupriavidus sp. D39]
MVNIIFLEDEEILRDEIAEYLESFGNTVISAATIADFREIFLPDIHRIVILDLGLPDGQGTEVIYEIRDRGYQTGIIVCTARGGLPDRVSGLQGGADYYLVKPIQLEELMSTVSTLHRRMTAQKTTIVSSWILDATNWKLIPPSSSKAIPPIGLSAQDFIVLRTLIEGCGQPVTRRQLVAALGRDYLDYDQRRLDTQMRRLRRKVIEACGIDLPVKTIHSVGYTFSATVEMRRD